MRTVFLFSRLSPISFHARLYSSLHSMQSKRNVYSYLTIASIAHEQNCIGLGKIKQLTCWLSFVKMLDTMNYIWL